MNLCLSQTLIAQLFMLIMSHANAVDFAYFNLCWTCPYFHKAASAVSSRILKHSAYDSVKETVHTTLQSVPQSLPNPQSVPKSVSKSVRSTVPQHHGRSHQKGILTFEVNKMLLATKSTTDISKAQETEKSADNIRHTVKSTTTTKKSNGRAYDHNCFFTPMNCQLYLRM